MALTIFKNISNQEKNSVIEKLVDYGSPRQEFFLMVVLAIAMATFGLILDSTVILIGSMLISPVLYPIIGIALGIVMADGSFIGRCAYVLLKSAVFSVIIATLIGIFVNGYAEFGTLITFFTSRETFLMSTLVAIVAGLAATFSMVKSRLSEALPGVAISVSLIPPLAGVGLGISHGDWSLISSAILIFIINTAGIIFASMVVFSMFNFYEKRKKAGEVVKEEEKEIKKEIKKAENKTA